MGRGFLVSFENLATGYFKNGFFCHPERSEGSQLIGNTKFFASLRMTFHCKE
jgi:hypothetical protein